MRRRRIITSVIEGWDPWEQTRENLESTPRPELERYVHDIVGMGYRSIREASKATLIEWISVDWEKNPRKWPRWICNHCGAYVLWYRDETGNRICDHGIDSRCPNSRKLLEEFSSSKSL